MTRHSGNMHRRRSSVGHCAFIASHFNAWDWLSVLRVWCAAVLEVRFTTASSAPRQSAHLPFTRNTPIEQENYITLGVGVLLVNAGGAPPLHAKRRCRLCGVNGIRGVVSCNPIAALGRQRSAASVFVGAGPPVGTHQPRRRATLTPKYSPAAINTARTADAPITLPVLLLISR